MWICRGIENGHSASPSGIHLSTRRGKCAAAKRDIRAFGIGRGLDDHAAPALFLFQKVADRRLGQSLAFHDAIHFGRIQRLISRQRLGDRLDAVLVGFEQLAGIIVQPIDESLGLLVDGAGGLLGLIVIPADFHEAHA
jgi:hypothetical protein